MATENRISVPSYLSSDSSGISPYAACGTQANVPDCGTCQEGTQSCGDRQYGPCDICQGWSQCASCETGCQSLSMGCDECVDNCFEGCAQGCGYMCQDQCEVEVQLAMDYWDWHSSNGSATASQTNSAYTAITSQGKTINFSYLVWNDLVDKIYEAISYEGHSWNTKFATYSATRMSSSDKELTAARFNSARYNIGLHSSTGINEVFRGDTVYGHYFTTIATALNSLISTLTI